MGRIRSLFGRERASDGQTASINDTAAENARVLEPGTVVATYCEALRGWSAAVVVYLNEGPPFPDTVSVLELAWHSEGQPTLRDVAGAAPLRLTHHAHAGRLSYCNHAAELPRNYVVVGRTAPPQLEVSNRLTPRWKVGQQLARQLRWDSGERGDDPRTLKCNGAEFDALPGPRPEVWHLTVDGITALDCRDLVEKFPNVSELTLNGDFGILRHAATLVNLRGLKLLSISELFGMDASDHLPVTEETLLDAIYLHNVPAEYADATRKAWRPERGHGTTLKIVGARTAEWVAENRDNPLREWDARPHISKARYAKSLAQYKETRRAVLAAISEETASDSVLRHIGREYGDAFNRLDGNQSPFIETVERDDLYAALDQIVRDAGALSESETARVIAALAAGVDDVRNW